MEITSEDYMQYKPLLFSLGYRMLGSVAEAEDVVHETFLKAYQLKGTMIENKKAYLCKILTNRCLDILKSVRMKRMDYVGPWNPEPLLLDQSNDNNPPEILLQREGLSIAYLRLMENLKPDERAVLLLRQVFEFSYQEIASMVEKKESNCRQIFSRAKRKMTRVEEESLSYESNKLIVNRFIEAFQLQDMETLLELVSNNVTLYSDGGGKVTAATRPIISFDRVMALLFGIIKKVPADFRFELKNANQQPAIFIFITGKLHSVISFYINKEKIIDIYMTMNPEKLPCSEKEYSRNGDLK
ncbi:RNA polymerase sigma-70 factor [Oceanobacillus piezotolerans]|uniref:RNA polymerase sigma-70 factor n=1 Tax=Oceanobacillus piezotolerans TaxID=2448030 RepID=A0A498D9L6_9BACI|nr:RNA polymerase sigma-70 factor [Oceanobacillus piezotolerans]RLL43620.1 RNA polymerase sigma-70 factor [Oceanobacillus piezotolerans]